MFKVYCDKDAKSNAQSIKEVTNPADNDNKVLEYTGPEGCPVYEIDPGFLKGFGKFLGAGEIIIGLAMAFFGSKFIFYVLRFLVLLLVNIVAWLALYNLNIINVGSAGGSLFLVAVIIMGLGAAAAYYFGNFAEKYAVSIIAGLCGAAMTYLLLAKMKIKSFEKQVLMLITGGLFVYLGRQYNKYVKSIGTAVIGSFLLMQGIGAYAGGFPHLMDGIEVDG